MLYLLKYEMDIRLKTQMSILIVGFEAYKLELLNPNDEYRSENITILYED